MKNKGGRPLEWNQDTVNKLEYAFSIGCPVTEACLYAGISRQTFYNNCREGSPLFDRFMSLREKPVLKARETVVKNLSEPEHAKWYLKNKKGKEFNEKTVSEVTQEIKVKPDEAKKILESIEENEQDNTSGN